MSFELFAVVLLSHIIGDFALQTNRIVKMKESSNFGLLLHVSIHFFVLILLLDGSTIPKWLFLGIATLLHFTIDKIKVLVVHQRESESFLIDQLAHLLVLAWLSYNYDGAVSSRLPVWVLYPSVLYGLSLPATMYLWIWSLDAINTEYDSEIKAIWRRQMFRISKWAGLPLIAFIVVSILFVFLTTQNALQFSLITSAFFIA